MKEILLFFICEIDLWKDYFSVVYDEIHEGTNKIMLMSTIAYLDATIPQIIFG